MENLARATGSVNAMFTREQTTSRHDYFIITGKMSSAPYHTFAVP
jgi:hypothetical protein